MGLLEEKIKDHAAMQYPFLRKHKVNVFINPKANEGYAETWPSDEEGDPVTWPRPAELPYGQHGVEIKMPDKFSPSDYAAEVFSHIDPIGVNTADKLRRTMTAQQLRELVMNSSDFGMSLDLGYDANRAMDTAAMGAVRGYVFGQWPKNAFDSMGLTHKQYGLLDSAVNYSKSGGGLLP